MIHFFKLIRLKNLLLLVLTQILIKYALLEPLRQNYSISLALSTIDFIYLIIATVFIAAAGYIINDIEDVHAAKINKMKNKVPNNCPPGIAPNATVNV